MKLILGSQSPRRRELLGRMGLEFAVLTAEIEETKYETEDPETSVRRICTAKACTVAEKLRSAALAENSQFSILNSQLVLTADTIVVLDGKIMGKPHDAAEARAMLRALSGREHEVFTAFTLLPVGSDPLIAPVIAGGNDAAVSAAEASGDDALRRETRTAAYTHCEKTAVKFRELTEGEIAAYVATGEPMDKAGAYGIQGLGSLLVEGIRGDYFTVMGLPICQLAVALKRYGIDPLNPEPGPM